MPVTFLVRVLYTNDGMTLVMCRQIVMVIAVIGTGCGLAVPALP